MSARVHMVAVLAMVLMTVDAATAQSQLLETTTSSVTSPNGETFEVTDKVVLPRITFQ